MTHIPEFNLLASKAGLAPEPPKVLVTIDPGETTGFAVFHELDLFLADQFTSTYGQFDKLIELFEPTVVIVETYRLYEHKLEAQAWSTIFTLRLIGAIEYMLMSHRIGYGFQNAGQRKGFFTSTKMKAWNFHIPGKNHANDAIRHGAAYLLFGKNVVLNKDPNAPINDRVKAA